jgi:flagellar hook-length control protein FliK
MSMEHGVSASTVKTTHGAHGAGGPAYGKSQAGAVGGFASLLSGLGAEEDALSTGLPGLTAAESAVSEGLNLTMEDGLPAEDDLQAALPGLGVVPGENPALVPQEDDPASTAAAAALAALGFNALAGDATPSDDAVSGSAMAKASVAVTGAIGMQMPGEGGAAARPLAGRTGARQGVQPDAAAKDGAQAAAREVVDPRDLALSAKPAEVGARGLDGLGLQRQLGQQRQLAARADAAKSDALRSAKGEDVAARLGWRSDTAAQAVLAADGAQAGLGGNATFDRFGVEAGARHGEEGARATLHEFAATLGALPTGVTSASGVAASGPLSPAAAYTDAAMTPESEVAEQVSYWVGRGVRSAEISVKGLAENPIHITIEMQGQEAHVAFRAEQAETRQVLEDALPHLRELLEREGLTLADVSVGQSGPEGRGGSDAREPVGQRARLGGTDAGQGDDAAAGPQGMARVVPLPAGRTLDLFV